jgi:hypothetical protein
MQTKIFLGPNRLWDYRYSLTNTGSVPIHTWIVPGAFEINGELSPGDMWTYNITSSPYHPYGVKSTVRYDKQFHGYSMSPIPEPCTMLLMGTGLAGLAGIARRRRRQQ